MPAKMLGQVLKFLQIFGMEKLLSLSQSHSFSLPLIRGYFITNCVLALFETGLFEKLRYPGINLKTDFQGMEYNKDVLRLVIEYLHCAGLIEKNGESYYLKSETARKLEIGKGAFLFSKAYSPLINNLPRLLLNQARCGEEITRDINTVVQASTLTERLVPYPLVERVIRKHGFRYILDIGCGSGEFLIELCRMNKDISCAGIDLSEEAVAGARSKVRAQNLEDRIKLYVSNATDLRGLNLNGWKPDLITLMFLLHELLGKKSNEDKPIIDLLNGLASQFRDANIAICELGKQSPEKLRKHPSLLSEHFFYHGLSRQTLKTVEDWRDIFQKANFQIKEEIVFDFLGQTFFLLRPKTLG